MNSTVDPLEITTTSTPTKIRRPPRHSISQELDSSSSDSDLPPEEPTDDAKPSTEPHKPDNLFNLLNSCISYFFTELQASEVNEDSRHSVQRERISNFLSVPMEIEKLMLYGFCICLDAFLSIFTFLPIRCFMAITTILVAPWRHSKVKQVLGLSQKLDLLRSLLLFLCCYFFMYLDASRLYHSIRGQAVIKLYVIFNVLEIADRLCCSFGQDILDSFFSKYTIDQEQNTTSGTGKLNPILHFVVAIAYVCVHTLVLFYQVITLNVAINSHNNALFTLLVSNQFVEIKGSVFKRFEKENLFQISCSDIVERFQLAIFLTIISLRNLVELGADFPFTFTWYTIPFKVISDLHSQYTLSNSTMEFIASSLTFTSTFLTETLPIGLYEALLQPFSYQLDFGTYVSVMEVLLVPVLTVFATEILVDWLKHAFITKFNQIRPSVYSKFVDILCKDYIMGKENSDGSALAYNSTAVSRRLGFAGLPLSCLTVCIILQTSSMMNLFQCTTTPDSFIELWACRFKLVASWSLLFLCLVIVKSLLGMGLRKYSFTRFISMEKARYKQLTKRLSKTGFTETHTEFSPTNAAIAEISVDARKSFSVPSSPMNPSGSLKNKIPNVQVKRLSFVRGTSAQSMDSFILPDNETVLEKDEADLIGEIKISNPEGKVSLETIDRYTLYKSRIP